MLERLGGVGVVQHLLERRLNAQRLLDLLHRNPGYVMEKSDAVTWFAVRNSLISSTLSDAFPSSGYPSHG